MNWRFPGFLLWLAREVVKSSLDVARVVLSPRMPISPTVVEIDVRTTSPFGQALLGNTVTLTPGTVSLDLYDGRLTAHALTEQGAEALANGEANERVARLIGH